MPTFLDTNCLLRYLLADVEDQFEAVRLCVEQGACTAPEFIAECVYVLGGSVYGFDRADVTNTMGFLLDDVACEHEAAMRYALGLYRDHSLDFADCILAARSVVEGLKFSPSTRSSTACWKTCPRRRSSACPRPGRS